MTLQVIGKIVMQGTTCEKCGCNILLWRQKGDTIRCNECGAFYQLIKRKFVEHESKENEVEYSFDFIGFRCMLIKGSGYCKNACPAPGMYCKEHISEQAFKDARALSNYCAGRLKEVEDRLEQMEESKRIWLIQEISGIEDTE